MWQFQRVAYVFSYNFTKLFILAFTFLISFGSFSQDAGSVYKWKYSSIKIAEVTAGIEEYSDVQSSLYPNPANTAATISLELKKESDVQVAIYSINGTLITKKDYGKLSGTMLLPIDMSSFTPGMYFVDMTIDGKRSVKKLIKE